MTQPALFPDLGSQPVITPAPVAPSPPAAADDGVTLRPYQIDVTDRAARQVGRGKRRGIIQGSCGAGKTVVGAHFAKRCHAKGNRTLVIADRRRLVKQFGATLDRMGLPWGLVMAGSSRAPDSPIVLATRDTLAAWHNAGMSPGQFQLVIADEAHRSMGDTFRRLLKLYPDAAHLGLTATPARGDGRRLSEHWQWIECIAPPSQLIAEGWLVKPVVFAPPELSARRKQGVKSKGLAGDPVTHWKRHADGLRTIAFCKSVAESVALRDRFLSAGIPAEHIDASVSDEPEYDDRSERDRIYDRLAAGTTLVLCSVKLPIEGVDIPEVAAIILWSKFGSPVEFHQATGRSMRPAPWIAKSTAIILDHAGAAAVHGLPGEDVPWSLDDDSTVNGRRNDEIDAGKRPRTVYCRKCGAAFTGPACGECGWRAPRDRSQGGRDGEVYHARQEMLAEFNDKTAAYVKAEAQNRFWRSNLYMTAATNRTLGVALAMFKKQFGVLPWEAGVSPLPDRGQWGLRTAEVFPEFVRRKAATP